MTYRVIATGPLQLSVGDVYMKQWLEPAEPVDVPAEERVGGVISIDGVMFVDIPTAARWSRDEITNESGHVLVRMGLTLEDFDIQTVP